MSRRLAFRQADVSRALKGALAAGLTVTRVEIGSDGKIVIVSGKDEPEPANDFDKWKARHASASEGH